MALAGTLTGVGYPCKGRVPFHWVGMLIITGEEEGDVPYGKETGARLVLSAGGQLPVVGVDVYREDGAPSMGHRRDIEYAHPVRRGMGWNEWDRGERG